MSFAPARWISQVLCAGLLLPGAGLAWATSRQPPLTATATAPAGAGAATEVELLVQRYGRAQRVVLEQQICLMTTPCATDEGRLLDALASIKQVLAALAERAAQGDDAAAYQRGELSLQAAAAHRNRSAAESDAQYPATGQILRRRNREEVAIGERYLAQAASQGYAPACQRLAQHLADKTVAFDTALVSRLYRCAVRGYLASDQRPAAVAAYVAMRQALKDNDLPLIEMHALLFKDQIPERSWRRVEPAEAGAIRRQQAP